MWTLLPLRGVERETRARGNLHDGHAPEDGLRRHIGARRHSADGRTRRSDARSSSFAPQAPDSGQWNHPHEAVLDDLRADVAALGQRLLHRDPHARILSDLFAVRPSSERMEPIAIANILRRRVGGIARPGLFDRQSCHDNLCFRGFTEKERITFNSADQRGSGDCTSAKGESLFSLKEMPMFALRPVLATSTIVGLITFAATASALGPNDPQPNDPASMPQGAAKPATAPATPVVPANSAAPASPGSDVTTSTTRTTAGGYGEYPSNEPTVTPDTVTTSPVNRPLLIAGGAIIVASYVPAIVVAASSGRKEDEFLYIPVAGPWLDLANRDCARTPCNDETLNKTLLIGGGILHAVGTAFVVTSLFLPETKKVASSAHASSFTWNVAPFQTRGGSGFSAFGTF